jgi:hypothetical protein
LVALEPWDYTANGVPEPKPGGSCCNWLYRRWLGWPFNAAADRVYEMNTQFRDRTANAARVTFALAVSKIFFAFARVVDAREDERYNRVTAS